MNLALLRKAPDILQTNADGQYVEIKCQLDATDDFYCRSYCLLNMFPAPLCPSSGAREYYTGGYVYGLRAAARKSDK